MVMSWQQILAEESIIFEGIFRGGFLKDLKNQSFFGLFSGFFQRSLWVFGPLEGFWVNQNRNIIGKCVKDGEKLAKSSKNERKIAKRCKK